MEEKKKIKSLMCDIIKGIKFGLLFGLTVGFIIGIVKGVSSVSSNEYFQYSLFNLAFGKIQPVFNSVILKSIILSIVAVLSITIPVSIIRIYRESGLALISSLMILLYIASFRRITPFNYLLFILLLYGLLYPIGISAKLREKFSFLNKVANGKLVLMPIILIFICNGFIYSYRLTNRSKGPNIILISIDALRADHLGCYGYHRKTSPNIDRLAREGTLFKNGFSQATWTLPSHVSIFLSQYVWRHKVDTPKKKLGNSPPTLAEILRDRNYTTCAFVGAAFLLPEFGLNRGFETYKFGKFASLEKCLGWLESVKDKKFFLFLHTYDVHSPYGPPRPYRALYIGDYSDQRALSTLVAHKLNDLNLSPEEIDYIIALYDAGINYVDDEIGELVKKLKKLNIFNNSVIIITADHGERLGERRGRIGHGGKASRIVTHVPLIMKVPGIGQGKVIEEIVESIDITPTILDILDISPPKGMQGKSILPLIKGNGSEVNFVAYTGGEWKKASLSRAVRTKEWTYIMKQNRPDELYDRINDPKEQNNIIKKRPLVAQKLKEELEDFIALTSEAKPQVAEKVRIDEELKESLKSLGYLH